MAALQERNGSYRVIFWQNGKQHAFTLGQVSVEDAEATAATVGKLLRGVEEQRIRIPPGLDVVAFLRQRLAVAERESDDTPEPIPQPRNGTTLGILRDRYIETHRNGTIEANSLDTIRLHFSNFCRSVGEGLLLSELSQEHLQDHINRRAKKGISPVTIRKEIASIRAAWNWGGPMKLTSGQFPTKGLRYPKGDEKPPFMTLAEIERKIAGGEKGEDLLECLYLSLPEITELLDFVRGKARQPWIYPLIAFAAYTGARRSEMLRALVADVDLAGGTVQLREKKRVRGQKTTRRVPLVPPLKKILEEWLAVHPGGLYLFCSADEVARSKKRSRTTGHKGQKARATSLKERMKKVKLRSQRPGKGALTKDEARDHLKRTLAGSKWGVLSGFHVLRHSFISACASKAVDQRLIDEWVGHSTEEMRKRYRHLYPDAQQSALNSVFG
jgi:integrase